MHGRGNYGPQYGQGPGTPVPPPYQQYPPAPPHHSQFHQGPSGSQPPSIQRSPTGPLAATSMYNQGLSAPSHQGHVEVPPSGIGNSGQSYLQPPPPPPPLTDGARPVAHKYANARQSMQYHSHSVTQSMHHILPPPPPHPPPLHLPNVDMTQASRPQGVLPPPPVPPPFHIMPQPSPPQNASISIGSVVQGASENSPSTSMHPLPTPPLPASPPPVQPSPPSSMCPGSLVDDKLSRKLCSGPSNTTGADAELRTSKAIDISCYDGKDKNNGDVGSLGVTKALPNENEVLPSHPASPTQEKENKCQSDFPLTPLANASEVQQDQSDIAPVSHPPADSDMEMEDDITQPDGNLGLTEAAGGVNFRFETFCNESDVKDQLRAPESSTGCRTDNVTSSGYVSEPGYLAVCDLNNSSIGRSNSKVGSPVREAVSAGKCESNGVSGDSSSHLPENYNSSVGSQLDKGMDSELNSDDHVRSGSPIRLLQDYASDDDTEIDKEHVLQYVSPKKVPLSLATGTVNLRKDSGKLSSRCSPSYKTHEFTPDPVKEIKGMNTVSVDNRARDVNIFSDQKTQSQSHVASHEDFCRKDVVMSVNCSLPENHKPLKEIENLTSASLRVDEFGRLVREGATDSDSDEERFTRRSGKRVRNRSRSRSRSPISRSRRGWSLRRRRERRSHSRSWSPRNRRRRSRSPNLSRVGEFRGNNPRRNRIHPPECFDFIKGRCHRGETCRFRHHDPDKAGVSGHHRSSQHSLEFSSGPRGSGLHKKIQNMSNKVSQHGHDVTKNQEGKITQCAEHACQEREGHIRDYQYQGAEIFENDGKSSDCHVFQPENLREMGSQLYGLQSYKVEPKEAFTRTSDTGCMGTVATVDDADEKPVQKMDDFSVSYPLHDKKSVGSPKKVPSFETNPNMMCHSQLLHDTDTPVPKSCNSLQQTSSFPAHSAAVETSPSYMVPEQHSYFPLPSSSSWTSLLPPPPPRPPYDSNINAGYVKSASSQIQSGHLALRNDFGSQPPWRPYGTGLPPHYLSSGYGHRAYLPMQDLSHGENIKLQSLPPSNPIQQYGDSNIIRDDCLGQSLVQGLTPSKSLQDRMNVQSISSSRNIHADKMESTPPDDHLKLCLPAHPEQQVLSHKHQDPAGDSVLGVPGKINYSMSGYPPSLSPSSQPSHPLADFGGFRISAHKNPYASIYEKPLSSRFSSNIFWKENDAPFSSKYNAPTSSHNPLDRGDVGSFGSRQTTSSPNLGKVLRSGGDQYDPLFDSIEPSANSSQKFDHVEKPECNDSDAIGLTGSNKPLDVEEDSRKKQVGAVAPNLSLDNDEYGETADAEVGAVENESPSNHMNAAKMAAGEVEIDQVNSPGKKKKSKDSRSMKLFRVALANFVKDVLKPSWRQGNMSKEAFKTIVKKTVDKVSAAMKSHQIPKSQAKIDQYIDSSQRKLTKLVMGYVDKYVKV